DYGLTCVLEVVQSALSVSHVLVRWGDACQGRNRQVHDALGLVLVDDVFDLLGVGYVELFAQGAGAQGGLKEVWLAAVLVVGDDDVLAGVEEGARGVQADEAHAADEQRSLVAHGLWLSRERRRSRTARACHRASSTAACGGPAGRARSGTS